MTKKTINIGATVDDYSGDYLRQGAEKINDNFDEIYSKLGDDLELHAAGRWQKWTFADGAVLDVNPGEAWSIDTTGGEVTVNLPPLDAVGSDDYNKVVKIRDVYGSWATNKVTVNSQGTNIILAGEDPTTLTTVDFNNVYTDLTFVFCTPATTGAWRYIPGLRVTGFATEDAAAGVVFQEFTADGITDTFDAGGGSEWYNKNAVQVYRNGALLKTDDYSSADIIGNSIPLNGLNIKILDLPDADDIITVLSFTQTVSASATAYERYSIAIIDEEIEGGVSVPGQTLVTNLQTLSQLTLQNFGLNANAEFNANAFQMYVNGHMLTPAGQADLPSGGGVNDEYVLSGDNKTILLDSPNSGGVSFENRDIVTIVWYNTEVGSTIPWTGSDSILSRGNEVWINSEQIISRTNKKAFIDGGLTGEDLIDPSNVVDAPAENSITVRTINSLFESIYPIGSIYENAINPANPGDYIGFGVWQPYAEGKLSFGYDSADADFDDVGEYLGSKTITLTAAQIPQLALAEEVAVLESGDSGDINISGCLPAPGDPSTPVASISSKDVPVNDGSVPNGVTLLPPYIVSYKWVRVG